jgi:hypothetical protein
MHTGVERKDLAAMSHTWWLSGSGRLNTCGLPQRQYPQLSLARWQTSLSFSLTHSPGRLKTDIVPVSFLSLAVYLRGSFWR